MHFHELIVLFYQVIHKLVFSSTNRDSQHLGCYYIIWALALTNPVVTAHYPWLYESTPSHVDLTTDLTGGLIEIPVPMDI